MTRRGTRPLRNVPGTGPATARPARCGTVPDDRRVH